MYTNIYKIYQIFLHEKKKFQIDLEISARFSQNRLRMNNVRVTAYILRSSSIEEGTLAGTDARRNVPP